MGHSGETPNAPVLQAGESADSSEVHLSKATQKFYHHEPLSHETGEQIRLIRLEDTSSLLLSFSMIHVELADAPGYIALSYAW
jgi:hypothetical protein